MLLPEDLQDWIRDNAADLVTVLRYLKSSPPDFATMLTVASTEADLPRAFYDDPQAAREQGRVREWLTAALFGPCALCFAPCIQFQTGQQLAWPELDWHDCNGLIEVPDLEPERVESTPIRRPVRASSRAVPL